MDVLITHPKKLEGVFTFNNQPITGDIVHFDGGSYQVQRRTWVKNREDFDHSSTDLILQISLMEL